MVTSGYRTSLDQALAMYEFWLKLERGNVYKKSTLPERDRKSLDAFFITATDPKKSLDEKSKARRSFINLAVKTVGTKSAHCKGRAVDVARAALSPESHKAILTHMREVKEGKRTDICHFESLATIPKVTGTSFATGATTTHSALHSNHSHLHANHSHLHPNHSHLHPNHSHLHPNQLRVHRHDATLAETRGDYICAC